MMVHPKDLAMPSRLPSTLRLVLIFVATGCLLGALTVAAVVFGAVAPALAACSSHHTNVEGYDAATNRYGNSEGYAKLSLKR